jgi:polyhydroxybutyrate depolymerase
LSSCRDNARSLLLMPDGFESIEVGGRSRSYAWHAPPGLLVPAPLLLVLHGRRLTILEMKNITRFDAVADRHGFRIVYPEGYQHTWNDGRGNTAAAHAQVDDVGFIRALIDRMIDRGQADPARVGASGLSNGGVMCHRLGLELSGRIAAIAPVAGTMAEGLAEVMPSHAVSALLVHGSADGFVPIAGGRSLRGRAVGLLLGERISSTGCRAGTAVECWTVRGGGHAWPGGPRMVTLGRTTTRFDASETSWEFVAAHLPAAERRLGGMI